MRHKKNETYAEPSSNSLLVVYPTFGAILGLALRNVLSEKLACVDTFYFECKIYICIGPT